MVDEAKCYSPIHSTFEALVVLRAGIIMEKSWALSVDQCQEQAFQFLVHLINLPSILLRCNGFTRIQKDVVDQSAPDHQKMTMTFRGICLALGNA